MKIEFHPKNEVSKNFPPTPIKFKLPEWYKNLDVNLEMFDSLEDFFSKELPMTSTPFSIKKCIPVLDYLTSGYMVPFISDIFINPLEADGYKNYTWKSPYGDTNAVNKDGHPHHQCPVTINNNKHHYIKFSLQWVIKTPPGYSCLLYQPFYEFQNNITFLPAIVDTDTYDECINIIGYINANKPFMIKAGDPLMAVFPFKRDEWKMEIKDKIVDIHKSKYFNFSKYKFFGIYKDFFHSKKKYN